MSSQNNIFDVAIIGSGPAGMQAALVLARTRKKIVVLDDPQPPRNDASHGVHNFLGLDGLSPTEIRRVAWEQIDPEEVVYSRGRHRSRSCRAGESRSQFRQHPILNPVTIPPLDGVDSLALQEHREMKMIAACQTGFSGAAQ